MDEREYSRLADQTLGTIEEWLEEIESDDLDFSTGDGLINIEFSDGEHLILNRQAASKQLWLAASDRAWHCNWDPSAQRWLDDKEGDDLYALIQNLISEKIDEELDPIEE
jgi:CyaY protein